MATTERVPDIESLRSHPEILIPAKTVVQPYEGVVMQPGLDLNDVEVIEGNSYWAHNFTISFMLTIFPTPELLLFNRPDNFGRDAYAAVQYPQIRKVWADRVLRYPDKPMGGVACVRDEKGRLTEAPLYPQIRIDVHEGKSPNLQQYKVLMLLGSDVYVARCDESMMINDIHPLQKSERRECFTVVPYNAADKSEIFAMLIKGKSTVKDINFLRSEAAKLQPLI